MIHDHFMKNVATVITQSSNKTEKTDYFTIKQ